ncbi:hypothetical protein MK805_12695 [Shimazuella sp. AN120528]|uniref:hypothetical protein n=1 Tax=Shimazuella soli TaxID=1892854 RepID=UPI001F0E52A3|nr:hypothetical protein [Shimazuella soli]MCH5585801.1 hypothetical protein [Shimazuella soli]
MRERKRYSVLAVVITIAVFAAVGLFASKPWVHRPSLNGMALKAGYTNVKTVESGTERTSIVTARLGQCPVVIFRHKDEIDPDKFEVGFLVDGIAVKDKSVPLSGLKEELVNADKAVETWTKLAKKNGWISPVMCDARKPYNNGRWY